MVTDPIEIEESLVEVVNYGWEDEMRDFEETFDVEIQSQDSLDEWIKTCKSKKDEGMTNHIFYHLMVLKSAYPELFE